MVLMIRSSNWSSIENKAYPVRPDAYERTGLCVKWGTISPRLPTSTQNCDLAQLKN